MTLLRLLCALGFLLCGHAWGQNAVPRPGGITIPLTINPPANSLTPALLTNQSGAGTPVSPFVPYAAYAFNMISISRDVVNAAAQGGGTQNSFALDINTLVGGAGTTGNHGAMVAAVKVDTIPTTAGSYGGVWAYAEAAVNVGGTSLAPAGFFYGSNPQVEIDTAATFVVAAVGEEVDVKTDAAPFARFGINIVADGTNQLAGTGKDAGIALGGIGTWGHALLLTGYNSAGAFPLASGATIFGSDVAGTVAHGIDFSNIACTTDCFASPGFTIDGIGRITSTINIAQPANLTTFENQDSCTASITGEVPAGSFPCFQSSVIWTGSGDITAGGHAVAVKSLLFHQGTGTIYEASVNQPSIEIGSTGTFTQVAFTVDYLQGLPTGGAIGTMIGHDCSVPNPGGTIGEFDCLYQQAILPITAGGSIGSIYLIKNQEPTAAINTAGPAFIGGNFSTPDWGDQGNGTIRFISTTGNPNQLIFTPASGQNGTILWENSSDAPLYEMTTNASNQLYIYDHLTNLAPFQVSSGNLLLGETGKTVTLVGGVVSAGLPTSGAGGGLYMCVDTSGTQYKKASCP